MTEAVDAAAAATSHDPQVGLRAVAALRRLVERLEALQVDSARRQGWSWEEIGQALAVSRQAVHKEARPEVTVFERFTPDARQVVVRAQHEARGFAHPLIGTEHLLLGVLAAPDSPATAALAAFGVTLDSARTALGRLVGLGGFCDTDAAALRAVGIDLDRVRHAAEVSFGPGALDWPPAWRCRRRSLWRRRARGLDHRAGELPFMPRAKRALERARHEADHGRSGHVDVEHLLLGLLDPRDNMAIRLIRHLGVDPELVEAEVRARRDAAA